MIDTKPKILLVYNTAKYLYNLRLDLIRSLQNNGMDVYAAVPYDNFVEKLLEEKVTVVNWSVQTHTKNIFREIKVYRQLKLIIDNLKPEIVFNFTIKPVIYGSIASRSCGIKKIVSMVPGRGYLFSDDSKSGYLLRSFILPFYKRALSSNLKVFFQNREDKGYFLDKKIVTVNQCKVINGSGVNTKRYTPAEEVKPPNTFIMISRLLKEKGISEYFQAAQKLSLKYDDVSFLLIGPESDSPNAISSETISAWESCPKFQYLGEQSDVRPYLARGSVFTLPSYYNEGLPRSILEAMSSGLAIITTDWPGCKETVVDGVNGYLIPVKNSESLYDTMEIFILEEGLAKRMGVESRRMAIEKFDTNIVNQDIISELL